MSAHSNIVSIKQECFGCALPNLVREILVLWKKGIKIQKLCVHTNLHTLISLYPLNKSRVIQILRLFQANSEIKLIPTSLTVLTYSLTIFELQKARVFTNTFAMLERVTKTQGSHISAAILYKLCNLHICIR